MNYQIIKILENYFQKIPRFSWIKLISVLLYFKHWYCNTPSWKLPCLSRPLYQISQWPTEIFLQHIPLHVLHWFSYFVLPYATTHHINWIYKTKCQSKSVKFIIKLYTNQYINGQTRYLSKIWAFESRFSFKSRQRSKQKLSIQSVLSSQQNGRYSFILKTILIHTITPVISTKYPFTYFS